MMFFYSTNQHTVKVDFRQATMQGQPNDKGLFFPARVPVLKRSVVENIKNIDTEELAFEILQPYVDSCIPDRKLREIISSAFNFHFPLKKITEEIYSLELFHGPTLAFKDVGARFFSRCLAYFKESDAGKTIVLVATSGDTGGAVANAFADVDGVHTVILYPKGKVSEIQELQLTTCGDRVTALEVNGTFDDCQKLVKSAFADMELNADSILTSANSINVARWLPQQLYYLDAIRQWPAKDFPDISVPSGNFGNIAAGMLAIESTDLPVRFISAMNANDAVHKYFVYGKYRSQKTVHTISNAMDVGDPSNFPRLLHLFGNDHLKLKSKVTTYSIDDELTKQTISQVYRAYGYLLDPHGAVAFAALNRQSETRVRKGIFLETAHPVKFANVIEPMILQPIQVPDAVKSIYNKNKKFLSIEPDYNSVREIVSGIKSK